MFRYYTYIQNILICVNINKFNLIIAYILENSNILLFKYLWLEIKYKINWFPVVYEKLYKSYLTQ